MATKCGSNLGNPAAGVHPSFRAILTLLATFAFGCGVLGILMGQFVSFYPGAEQGWFTACAVLVLAGLILPRWYHRVAAVLLVALCVLWSFQGRQRGEDCKTHLAARLEKSSSR